MKTILDSVPLVAGTTTTAILENRDPEDDPTLRKAGRPEGRVHEDDEIFAAALAITTLLKEGEVSEGRDDDDDITVERAALTMATKASGENEGADKDDNLMYSPNTTLHAITETDDDDALLAMTTTLTESASDNENDPDEPGYSYVNGGRGAALPLGYRFAEQGGSSIPRLRYDRSRQVHVLRNGNVAVEAIKERIRNSA